MVLYWSSRYIGTSYTIVSLVRAQLSGRRSLLVCATNFGHAHYICSTILISLSDTNHVFGLLKYEHFHVRAIL
jgi:hypothetical protein